MADKIVSKQELLNAQKDAETLEKVANGPAGQLVKSRMGREYYTLATFPQLSVYSRDESYSRAQVDALTAAIAGGHKAYRTLGEAQAAQASLPVNSIVEVTNDGANNGKYQWNGTTLTKSAYDPVLLGEQKTEEKLQTIREIVLSKNLYDASKAVYGNRLSGTGLLTNVADSKRTGFIPVTAGQAYILSWSNAAASAQLSYAFFASEADSQGTGYTTVNNTSLVYSFTVPAGVSFLVINLKQSASTVERLNVQVELGANATSYEPFGSKYVIKNDVLPSDIINVEKMSQALAPKITADDVPEIVAPLLVKDYDISIPSKNLFDESKIQDNKFLSTVDGSINNSSGWKISGFIPVVAGQAYTLSGTRGRQGISFFSTNVITDPAIFYDNTPTLPLTVTAPVGANYAVIALESATVKGWSNLQFEQGSIATPYKPYGASEELVDGSKVTAISVNQISDLGSLGLNKKANLSLSAGSGPIKSGNLEIELKVFNPVNYDGSAVFNFVQDKYKNAVVRINGDDSAPVRMMGATIGANHGYSRTILTLANHGKTNTDVGSVWTNGTYQWVILQIISTSQLSVTCRTLNIAFPLGNTLTHVSGATNTASFTPTAISAKQWYPMLKNHKVKLSLDGTSISISTFASGFNESLKISESYDLMEKADIVEWLILNGGKEISQYSAASACNVSHTHTFNSDLTDVISANFFVYKNLSAALDLMFTQSARMQAVNNEVLYYVPRSVAFTHESVSYDFSKPTNVANLAITNRIDFTVDRTEIGKAVPDRLIMLAGNLGYATGYLPILDAAPDIRNSKTSKGIQISNSEAKVYPYLVDSLTTLAAGANYSCVAYRAYFERPAESRRTSHYDVPHGNNAYLFLDWHTGSFVDVVELKPYLQGRSFEVIEKTENIEVLSKLASENIALKISSVSSNARLILKFT
ncbi:hypothetical protein H0920_10585 [Acinetobacter sp. C_4_1]|uniref:hypothetical protein n=1 Tax=unclassified Acinetobacter TaxID=196816 RepID=UPI0021B8330C|nr:MULTISPECIES: hypothetical protein [unclassified Acinetobacter]MCT8090726.1 hypothetical protein [Acinetobacter sp. F_3_1]MCT8101542.1 hypothetical protein [Acinetobacter sp. C_4_1]MCT8135123.1 hypothetical protein [Acinetobacter sp. T_3_1]